MDQSCLVHFRRGIAEVRGVVGQGALDRRPWVGRSWVGCGAVGARRQVATLDSPLELFDPVEFADEALTHNRGDLSGRPGFVRETGYIASLGGAGIVHVPTISPATRFPAAA
jgi:hypothetical protein